jgi:hypothetical protein
MLRVKNKKTKKIIRKQKSKEWWLNWIQKLYETKFLGMKLKKKKLQKALQAKQIVIKRMRTKINRNRN